MTERTFTRKPIGSSIEGQRVYLMYPPGPLYQRGEDRSQGNISQSAATVMRAPNDMGYAAATLLKMNCEVTFTDFQTEMKSEDDLLNADNLIEAYQNYEESAFDPDIDLSDLLGTIAEQEGIYKGMNVPVKGKHLKKLMNDLGYENIYEVGDDYYKEGGLSLFTFDKNQNTYRKFNDFDEVISVTSPTLSAPSCPVIVTESLTLNE